ncbi:MAG: copper chaperone PCu(A)C [Gammaproteobacteria bacterium]|nr:copper chaperone PCu(A)C [Gammaproteobacteria bacterium]MDE1983433.1 copper chaperone PCu(A)C [Gammaproteobacteria bacterium]MDE2107944.1 copper chaperone PCu(A)C [Gammaproteobacteria bacterium]
MDTLAAYLTLTNHTGETLTLSNVSSTDFNSVTVHRTLQNNGMDSMVAVPHLSIPAHQSVKLAPGGYHLMLMQPIKPLYDGDLVMLTFTFSDHSSLSIMAPVRRDAPQS